MTLTFVESLDENQSRIAVKIAEKAKEMGIDPKLAVAIAYKESGLHPHAKTGAAGEIGIMQIKPDTAKLFGYKKDDLHDVDTNIKAGLTFLKSNLDKFDNDPKLATVAYNAGPDSSFFSGGKLPEITESYIKDLNKWGAYAPVEANAPTPPAVPVPASEQDFNNGLMDKASALIEQGGQRLLSPESILGAQAGAGMATAKGASDLIGDWRAANAGKPGNTTGVQNWTKEMGYGERGAKTYGQAHEFEQGTRKGATVRNPATGQTFKPEFRFQKPPVVTPTGMAAVKSGLQGVGNVMTKLPPVSGAVFGSLGALGTVSGAEDTMNRVSQGDYLGGAISGLGAAGSAASMIPHPMTRAVGSGLAMASPAALMVLDKMRQQTEKQPQRALQSTDAMGNPLQ
jgi:hypothetical protein